MVESPFNDLISIAESLARHLALGADLVEPLKLPNRIVDQIGYLGADLKICMEQVIFFKI